MGKTMNKIAISVCSFLILNLLSFTTSAWGNANLVRAKVGIKISSNEVVKLAKSKDRLKTGDLLNIYVRSTKASFIYVVHSDNKIATLLTRTEQKLIGSILVLPSTNEYYEIDGTSNFEKFCIIISPVELKKVNQLFDKTVSHDEWVAYEKALVEKSKVTLNEKSKTSFVIAGNVRGVKSDGGQDALVKQLKIFTGNSMVVKKYDFKIKK